MVQDILHETLEIEGKEIKDFVDRLVRIQKFINNAEYGLVVIVLWIARIVEIGCSIL